MDNLSLTAAQRRDADQIVEAITQYVEGQINKSVERRHFRQRQQQPGEPFDDFLVSLRESAKTCKFCSDGCTQKSIQDQIIEGFLDGDTVEDLLKERDLTLSATISKCRAQEAAKQQRAEITNTPVENICSNCHPGCGSAPHQGGRPSCPAYQAICHNCNKNGHFARVCCSRRQPPTAGNKSHPITSALILETQVRMATRTNPAPTVTIHMSSLNGAAPIIVLPDSGAEISIAGHQLLHSLNEHRDNLLPSNMSPRAVNGSSMNPIRKLPVTLRLGDNSVSEEFHIYEEVSTTLISWKTAKDL